MRDICVVIDNIIVVVPEEQERLHHELQSIRSSAEFSSPENMGLSWKRLNDECNNALPEDNEGCKLLQEEWHFQMIEELTTMSREELDEYISKR